MFRIEEGKDMTPEQKEAKGGEVYLDLDQIDFDRQKVCKGPKWRQKGKCLQQAKKEINEENKNGTCPYDCSTAKLKKHAILDYAEQLAKAVVRAIRAGQYFEAFKAAGDRVWKDTKKVDEFQAAWEAYAQNPKDDGVKARFEAAERAIEETTDY